ncbi:hypothetical protein PP175_20045 [Aneurinibacillus sp. Ricciae_BoGa-3]|uniref:hypothetical protein n=1 Tax=Aneurinibacillus sp. Ricciae_BoGa-3 TaxID=3022697 RepID=UPI00233FAC03|nr:hypothetical protein [Aneurinibacillus sp. Ricciae_BoGa-3]WCK53602.1 hypothetical protein PP175_20045 [Aneurinibacillus sp. Ricciae_BoGa-3]
MRLATKPAAVCQINNKIFAVDFHSSIEKQMEISDIELAREMGLTQHEIQLLEGKLSR